MAVVMGVQPGGKGHFALSALFWPGRLPALLFAHRVFSGVQEVLDNIAGVCGEWGEVRALAMDAPLTWSAEIGGRRRCDEALRARMPTWFPATWLRAPNALPGATTILGPALVWAMAREAKSGVFPQPPIVETNARASLARLASDMESTVLGYCARDAGVDRRRQLVRQLVGRLVDAGLVRIEAAWPTTPDELEALTCGLTALACAFPESGLILQEFEGEAIRPVGRRPLVIIDGLP